MIDSKIVPVAVVLALAALSHGWVYLAGQDTERVKWQLQLSRHDRDNNAVIVELQQQIQRTESRAASELLAAETHYQARLNHVETEKSRILAAHLAGTARLSIPVKTTSCTAASPAANIAGGGADPAPRAELSDTAAGFLVSLAAEADSVAVELNRCADRIDVLQQLLQ